MKHRRHLPEQSSRLAAKSAKKPPVRVVPGFELRPGFNDGPFPFVKYVYYKKNKSGGQFGGCAIQKRLQSTRRAKVNSRSKISA